MSDNLRKITQLARDEAGAQGEEARLLTHVGAHALIPSDG